jgi:hypothetical protein
MSSLVGEVWALNSMSGMLLRGGHKEGHNKGKNLHEEAETGVRLPQAKEPKGSQKLEEKSKDPPLCPSQA